MKIDKIELLKFDREWEQEFKVSLLEGIEDYKDICTFINVALNEWFPIWKEENPDLINIYEYFEKKLSAVVNITK
ncbi:hypothetical protein [uncultured Clostridium sp.]|uniref:hypothetical protein n=1 Tax=uncultured Clostridium sp. TaxID=59620 RepID=UPI0027DBFF03|nr:hypothetical protein [uncultured Clostridium sp.]